MRQNKERERHSNSFGMEPAPSERKAGAMSAIRLKTLLGDHPVTAALKRGDVSSSLVALDFANVEVPNTAFKRVVRDLEFDVAELAIVTFLMAKAQGAPLTLLPAVLMARLPASVHRLQCRPRRFIAWRSQGPARRHPLIYRDDCDVDSRHSCQRLRRRSRQHSMGDVRGRACCRLCRPAEYRAGRSRSGP